MAGYFRSVFFSQGVITSRGNSLLINLPIYRYEVEILTLPMVGETINFTILTNGTRIRCKGRVLATENLGNEVVVRLCFAPPSDWEYGKLSNYLHGLSAERKMPSLKWVIVGLYGLSAYLAYLFIRAFLFK